MTIRLCKVTLDRRALLGLDDEALQLLLDKVATKKVHQLDMERRTRVFRMLEELPGPVVNIPVPAPCRIVASATPVALGDTNVPRVISVSKEDLLAILAAFL